MWRYSRGCFTKLDLVFLKNGKYDVKMFDLFMCGDWDYESLLLKHVQTNVDNEILFELVEVLKKKSEEIKNKLQSVIGEYR
jgi:hypothetical protein